MHRIYFVLAVLLSFCGCSHTQEAGLPESRKASAVTAPSFPIESSSPSLPPAPAEPASGPLTLQRAIDEALKASPELEQIRHRVDGASQQARQAEASFYPRLVVAEDFNVTDNPVYALMNIINQRRLETTVNFNEPGQQQNFSSRVQGEWLLFEGGSRLHDRNAALGRKSSLDAEWLAARNQMVAKVTETYWRWLQALGFIGVAERALEAAQTDEKLGEARLHAQAALPSEVMRLRVRRAEAESHLVSARTSTRRFQAALERLLTRPIPVHEIPQGIISSADSSRQATATARDSNALVKQALDRRPEMASVRALIEAGHERVKSARGGWLPKVGANVFYQWDSEDLSGSGESWYAAVQASWPLFEGGMTLARVREAESHLREMEARGEQVSLDIALEVQQAALAVEEASEKIRVAEERKNLARQAMDETRHLYRNEMVGVDSLLQAETAWNQAEVAYTAALFEERIAQALLRASLGDFVESVL